MAVETGISPNDLLESDPVIFGEVLAVLQDRQEQVERARRKAGR